MSVSMDAPVQEVWVIPQVEKSRFEKLLETSEVSPDYLEEVLASQRVCLEFKDVFFEQSVSLNPLLKKESHPTLLSQREGVSVYYPDQPKTFGHLWVVLDRDADHFSEISSDEAVSIRKTMNTVIDLLRRKMNLPDVAIAQWNELQPGHFSKRLIAEIIPACPQSTNIHNGWERVEFNNHILFAGRFASHLPVLTEKEKEAEISFWQKKMTGKPLLLLPEKANLHPTEEWVQVVVDNHKARKVFTDQVYETLCQEGFTMRKEVLLEPLVEEDRLESKKTGCPFCLEKIIALQQVYETSLSRVLYNHRPSVDRFHFLIIPKRHAPRSEYLLEAEVRDIHELSLRIVEFFRRTMNRTDVIFLTQDGSSVGQTVKHTHIHAMVTPLPLPYLTRKINFDKEGPLTKEQMEPILLELKTQFKLLE